MARTPNDNDQPAVDSAQTEPVQSNLLRHSTLQTIVTAISTYARLLRRKLRWSSGTVGKVGSFLTGLATIIGAIAVFLPLDRNDTPDVTTSNLPITTQPIRLSATLSDVMIDDTADSLGDYCDRRGLACEGYGPSQREWPGVVISYAIQAEGYEGQQLALTWSMYSVTPRSRLNDPALVDQHGWPDGIYMPEASSDRNSGEIWAAYPATAGEYFVRLELHPPSGTRLDAADTESFVVSDT